MTRAAPFIHITLAFAAGIWLASQFALPAWFCALATLMALVALLIVRQQHEPAWFAACVMLFAVGAGWFTLRARAPTLGTDTPAAYNGNTVVLEGIVADEPDTRPDITYLRVQVQRLVVGAAIISAEHANGIVLVRAGNDVLWQYGDVVSATGLLDAPPIFGDFDYRDYLVRQGVYAWISKPDHLQVIGADQGSPLFAALLRVKAALRLSTQRIMPAPESALLNGILIGDANELPANIQNAFRRTGTSHIVAISGFNVSIVIALVMPWLSRLINRRRAALVAIPAILVYTLLVGASASVVRASAMAIIVLVGLLFWRRGFTLNTLCAAAFFMLLIDPQTLFDLGFQLSFMATLGLVLYADRLGERVQGWLATHVRYDALRKGIGIGCDVVFTTLAVDLTLAPILLSSFNQFSLVSLLTNTLVLPLQPAAMIAGIVASLSGVFSVPAGAVIALPAYALLTATLRIVEATSRFDWASMPVYGFGAWHAVVYYAALLGITAVTTQPPKMRPVFARFVRKYLRAGTILFAVMLLTIAGLVAWYQRPDGKLHVTFAGKGAFIQTPAGNQVVFGGDARVLAAMGRAMPLWDKGLELLILPTRDDYTRGDTLPMLQRYQVGTIIQPDKQDEPSAMLDTWMAATASAVTTTARVITVPMGTRAIIEPGVVLTFEERLNHNIGARVTYGATSFELAGDAGVISGTAGGADVIFVAVRGAAPRLLNAAQPRYVAWADAGGAPPGLDGDIRAFALRDVGQVEFISDGKTLAVR